MRQLDRRKQRLDRRTLARAAAFAGLDPRTVLAVYREDSGEIPRGAKRSDAVRAAARNGLVQVGVSTDPGTP